MDPENMNPDGMNAEEAMGAGIGPEGHGADSDTTPVDDHVAFTRQRGLTRRERRRRIVWLILLLLLLALLSYVTYFFTQNKRLPTVEDVGKSIKRTSGGITPPEYLYSITGEGEGSIQDPVGVRVSKRDRVYAVDTVRRRVSVYTKAGRYLFSFKKTDGGELGVPAYLWVTDDEVWVTDRGLKTAGVYVFDLDGKFKRVFNPKNEQIKWAPLGIAFDGDELRLTDAGDAAAHRLMYFSADESRTITIGKTFQTTDLEQAPGGFMFPNGIAIDSKSNVYVADSDNRRVQVFTEDGEFIRFIDTSGVPRGLCIDEEDRLYVVDVLAHTVDIYSTKGVHLTKFGSRGFGPGQFNYPYDVALDDDGRIYVSDQRNDQIQVWGWPKARIPLPPRPTTTAGWLAWAAGILPFLLFPPLFLLMRKTLIVVTPDFIAALEAMGEVERTSKRRRLRLIAPIDDLPVYEGRTVEGVDLTRLIDLRRYSESDAKALADKYGFDTRTSVLLSMAERAKGIATQDMGMRRAAADAGLRSYDAEEFVKRFLR